MLLNSQESSRRTRHLERVRVLALLTAGAIVIAGGASTACVSTSQYSQLQQERDALSARNNELATEKTALESKVASLQTQEQELDSKLREREEEARKLQETFDGLKKSLEKEMKSGQIEVEQVRDGLRVNVAQEILFDSGSAALDKSGTSVLGRVATQLKKSPHQILVIGHTDNKPISAALAKRYPTNWELAGARAASVVRLFAESGLSGKRMRAISVADTQPVKSNKTEEGRAKNRRIEIRVRPVAPDDQSS
jgi:chemotaxis protein MotB